MSVSCTPFLCLLVFLHRKLVHFLIGEFMAFLQRRHLRKVMSEMSSSRRQLTAMLHKNWLLKTRHPFTTLAEILMPMIVMMLLMGVRTRVDTQVHPVQAYVRKGMFVEKRAFGLCAGYQ
ncbi:hypothetical protein HPP92_019439 [Vanilla planifolia]|uniref:Uncharacterized protein n=1 Tax=Vanilla planifolia TaxID=51239 RepID=A0A835PZJ7_VANPL|nr:hypothetical protein HPP92_019439 [Vanilla planifolia]